MDILTTLICEYILYKDECVEYLKCMNIKHIDYEHIYKCYMYTPDFNQKKKVRKLCITYDSYLINCIDLSDYTNLMHVMLEEYLDNKLILPHSVTNLDLNASYTRKLSNLPSDLIHLDIGLEYNHKLPELTKLRTLCVGFDYEFKIKLPKTLKHLTWRNDIDDLELPHGLTHLTVSAYDISSLSKIIPSTLTHLDIKTFGEGTSHVPLTVIPLTVTHLTWGREKRLPKMHNKLTHLSLEGYYNRNTKNLPDSITHLIVHCNVTIHNFPSSLIYLKWACADIPHIPSTVKYLIIGDEDCDYMWGNIVIHEGLSHLKWCRLKKMPLLPTSLHTLIIHKCYRYDITTLPAKLVCLKLLCHEKLPTLPNTLITLELGYDYKHKLPKLPSRLNRIIISHDYKHINELRQTYGDKIIYNY
jgi:hypothetical protein